MRVNFSYIEKVVKIFTVLVYWAFDVLQINKLKLVKLTTFDMAEFLFYITTTMHIHRLSDNALHLYIEAFILQWFYNKWLRSSILKTGGIF